MKMKKCTYCDKRATTMDALGLDACSKHEHEADEYYRSSTGRDPNEDAYLYCEEHADLWMPGCQRCEECCRHHYNMRVSSFIVTYTNRARTIKERLPGMTRRDVMVLATEHRYGCSCDLCREWWHMTGPDPETGEYGPFGKEEVQCQSER